MASGEMIALKQASQFISSGAPSWEKRQSFYSDTNTLIFLKKFKLLSKIQIPLYVSFSGDRFNLKV